MTYNKVLQAGRLTKDPELRYTTTGTAVCNMSIAVNDSYTTAGGEKKESVFFLEIKAWSKIGENAAKYLSKGSEIFVEGRLRQEEWEYQGEKKKKLVVYADNIQFLTKKKADNEATPNETTQQEAF